MRSGKIILMICVLMTFTLSTIAQESSERRPPKERVDVQIIEALVESIEYDSRMVTLIGPQGNLVTVEVGKAVERLNEIKEGDLVSAEFTTYILAEFRNPTIEELVEPFVVIGAAEKAGLEESPYAGEAVIVRAIVTIEIINRPNMFVTVRGPRGNYLTIDVQDEQLIEQLNVGEVGILTYAEAVAISLEKIQK